MQINYMFTGKKITHVFFININIQYFRKRDIFALAGDSGTDNLKAGLSRPKRDVWSRYVYGYNRVYSKFLWFSWNFSSTTKIKRLVPVVTKLGEFGVYYLKPYKCVRVLYEMMGCNMIIVFWK